MDFAFTEDQVAITQAARDMLVDTCTPADLRRLLESGSARDEARWTTIHYMGLIGIVAPEAAGGLGLGMADLIGIAEAAGYVALPEPLIDLAGVAIPLLAELDDDLGWLEKAIGGSVVVVGHPANPFVPDADTAGALLLGDGDALHLVDQNAVTLTREETFDPFRRLFRVDWSPSPATMVASSAAPGWGLTAERGALFAAAQLVGLAQRCIDLSIDYAKDRMQFGKPIGSYQAVKHLLANAQVKVEFARPVVHAAAAELAKASIASKARIAHAKIAAGAAADFAARTAVQVHGAMGMTWEVDLHIFLKRAMALNGAWGTPAQHRETVMARIGALPTGPAASFASDLT